MPAAPRALKLVKPVRGEICPFRGASSNCAWRCRTISNPAKPPSDSQDAIADVKPLTNHLNWTAFRPANKMWGSCRTPIP